VNPVSPREAKKRGIEKIMDSSKQIISDLQEKIGSDQPVDFLCAWKGVPVVVRGYLQDVQDDRITFRVEPMDSVCLMGQEHALLLHDIFISGIQGNIRDFDIKGGLLTLDSFTYVDRGFGGRSMVRVEPETPIEAALFVGETTIPCDVVDISLNGFGLLTESISGGAPPQRGSRHPQTESVGRGGRNLWQNPLRQTSGWGNPPGDDLRAGRTGTHYGGSLHQPAASGHPPGNPGSVPEGGCLTNYARRQRYSEQNRRPPADAGGSLSFSIRARVEFRTDNTKRASHLGTLDGHRRLERGVLAPPSGNNATSP
jgi:hypothetical protein